MRWWTSWRTKRRLSWQMKERVVKRELRYWDEKSGSRTDLQTNARTIWDRMKQTNRLSTIAKFCQLWAPTAWQPGLLDRADRFDGQLKSWKTDGPSGKLGDGRQSREHARMTSATSLDGEGGMTIEMESKDGTSEGPMSWWSDWQINRYKKRRTVFLFLYQQH